VSPAASESSAGDLVSGSFVSAPIRILYFAQAARLAGCQHEETDFAPGLRLSQLREWVLARHPALLPLAPSLRFAVAEQFAAADRELAPGDTVAVLPPFSGG
jgi:molybdopterin converting factor small subunit